MATRDDVVAEARKWIGTKFRHQGRGPRVLDCGGLIVAVAKGQNLSDYDFRNYRANADGLELVKHFRASMDEILRPREAKPGAALIFSDVVFPCHCAILSEKNGAPHIIHAYEPVGAVLEEPLIFDWPGKLRFAFDYRGIEG